MMPYAKKEEVQIEFQWLDAFILLTSYEAQTEHVERLLKSNALANNTNASTLLTLAVCSTYDIRSFNNPTALPPIAAWWLDSRSAHYRAQVFTELSSLHPSITLKEKIQCIHDWTIAPVPVVRNVHNKKVIALNKGFAFEQTMSAHHVAQTVNTWFPQDAPEILHCLSPLWDLRVVPAHVIDNRVIQSAPVYTDVISTFRGDIAAQRLLVYLGHRLGPTDPEELHTLRKQLVNEEPLMMPWLMYKDLELSVDTMLQAERVRESGGSKLDIPDLLLLQQEVQP